MLVSWTLANLASVLFCRTLSFVFLGVHLIGNSCVVSFLCLTQVLDIRVTWRFVLFAVPRVRVLLGSHTYEEHPCYFFFRRVRDSDENSQNPTTLFPYFLLLTTR